MYVGTTVPVPAVSNYQMTLYHEISYFLSEADTFIHIAHNLVSNIVKAFVNSKRTVIYRPVLGSNILVRWHGVYGTGRFDKLKLIFSASVIGMVAIWFITFFSILRHSRSDEGVFVLSDIIKMIRKLSK